MSDENKKVPMAFAAHILSTICEDIDGADQIDAFLIHAFGIAEQNLANAVDRRIAFNNWAKVQLAAAKEAASYYVGLQNKLTEVHERFKARTKDILAATPDIPYSGKLGKISIAKNGGLQSLVFSFGDKAITPESAAFFGVPPDYVLTKVSYSIDVARVRAELDAGITHEWVSLADRGSHVNFPRASKQTALPESEE